MYDHQQSEMSMLRIEQVILSKSSFEEGNAHTPCKAFRITIYKKKKNEKLRALHEYF